MAVLKKRVGVRVLVVGDDPLLRLLLCQALAREEELCVVGDAASGAEAADKVRALAPEVALIDLGGEAAKALDALALIAGQGQAPRLLVLTPDADEERVLRAICLGAHGYVPRSSPSVAEAIPKAIRALAAGEAWVESRLTGRLLEELAKLSRRGGVWGSERLPAAAVEQPRSGASPVLSLRERQVIRLIAGGKTNLEIAAQLALSPHTVKSHVSHILQKLDLPNRTEVAVFAARVGLLDAPAEGATHAEPRAVSA
jgi:two-component system, NarL family, response regulator LiaR